MQVVIKSARLKKSAEITIALLSKCRPEAMVTVVICEADPKNSHDTAERDAAESRIAPRLDSSERRQF